MSRKLGFLVGAVIVAMCVAVAPTPALAERPTKPSGPKSSTPSLVGAEFNLAGWQQHAGGLAPAWTVVDRVRSAKTPPLILAVVETCSAEAGQWELLQQQLGPLGYSFVWSPSIGDFGRAGCAQFGNGLAVLGTVTSTAAATFEAQRVSAASSYQELRNIVCATFDTSASAMTACATHLVNQLNSDSGTTRLQAAEALRFADTWAGARIVGGDFNLDPGDASLDGWYAGYWEADASRRNRRVKPTHDSGVKRDYLFGNRAAFGDGTAAAVEAVDTSDHHWYVGTFPVS